VTTQAAFSCKIVNEPNPRPAVRPERRGIFTKLTEFLHPGPDSRDELLRVLGQAEERELISAESRFMIEGVLKIADMTAGDVMIAAPKMDMIDLAAPMNEWMQQVIAIAHSRYPVYESDRENIRGILMAKDLLKISQHKQLNIEKLLRPAVFVPENKRLIDLLRDFRNTRNHLAIVIDEFGQVAGLITIEDILEEIVGEIEDEFDTEEGSGDIFGMADRSYRVAGHTKIERINEAFQVQLTTDEAIEQFETIGGLIAHEIGHVPVRGESHVISGLRFEVMHAKSGSVKWFKVSQSEV
jgi:magnesium and cobalt transporter